MYHQTILAGRLGQDPEMRFTAGGTPVVNLSVAVDDGWGDNKTTIWYRVTAWKRTAEVVAEHLHKGDAALFVGRMRETDPWQDRQGNWRSNLEMTADRVQFLQTQRSDAAGNNNGPSGGNQRYDSSIPDIDDDEIPF